MYQGKYNQQQHQQRRRRRRKLNNRALILLASLVLIVGMAAGGTVAWLITNTGAVQNTMVPASVPITINETVKGTTKSAVTVTNTGNTDAYIRVAIVANAVDENGNVIAGTPPTYNVDTTKWELKNDGYYYYKGIVSAQSSTPALFIGNVNFANGEVNILAESIQVLGGYNNQKPETYAWGRTYNNGSWT